MEFKKPTSKKPTPATASAAASADSNLTASFGAQVSHRLPAASVTKGLARAALGTKVSSGAIEMEFKKPTSKKPTPATASAAASADSNLTASFGAQVSHRLPAASVTKGVARAAVGTKVSSGAIEMEFKKPTSKKPTPATASAAASADSNLTASFGAQVSHRLPAASVTKGVARAALGTKVFSGATGPVEQQEPSSSSSTSGPTSSCLYPVLARRPQTNEPVLSRVNERLYKRKGEGRPEDPATVEKKARCSVLEHGGNTADRKQLLGQHQIQFGKFKGMSFLWLMDNALGWVAHLLADVERTKEKPSDSYISRNKFLLKEYCSMFAEGRKAVQLKGARQHPQAQHPSGFSAPQLPADASCLPTPQPSTSGSSTVTDAELAEAADIAERQFAALENQLLLPEELKNSLPAQDRQWIGKALFRRGPKDKAELDGAKVDRLWYFPPEPSPSHPKMPKPDRYFAHKLCFWCPRKLWGCRLVCPNPDCQDNELTSAGLYGKTVRMVMDVDTFYLLMTEYLECGQCRKKLPSWHDNILAQLDLGHRLQFPAVLTYRYAADERVVRLLRQRGLGNGPMQVWKTLREQHTEAWLKKCTLYMTDVHKFQQASSRGLITHVEPEALPNLLERLPCFSWLQTVYVKDVLQRLDEVKASITSTFGRILKLDSTKKIVKKMAGHARHTAAWHTNVGNEHGQVLTSVVTAQEGRGLTAMAEGLMERYAGAGVQPPDVLYVDRDCCSGQTKKMFGAWPSLQIRLDIWHFMRRIASAVTTESHPLYAPFMGALSMAIFCWDKDDLDNLKDAKRAQMREEGIPEPSDADIVRRISKQELALHCRRATRGVDEMTDLISQLLSLYTQPHATDTLGVPLLDSSRIWAIWEEQLRHVPCLQDPEGVLLYQETAPLMKGGHLLKTYRCARGSTSLESFHLHLNRFIPGNSTSDLHYQVYLLEGLNRWNQDRCVAATGADKGIARTYSSLLCHGVNELSRAVFKQPMFSGFSKPHKYTGELLGIEYLYNQSSGDLYTMADSDEDQEAADMSGAEDEGFQEAMLEELTVATPQQVLGEEPAFLTLQDSRPSTQMLSQALPCAAACIERTATGTSTTTVTISPTPSTSGDSAEAGLLVQHSLPGPSGEVQEDSVGPNNIPGYAEVQQLAAYIVSLRDNLSLTNSQTATIAHLYSLLHDYDKLPTVFPPRYKSSQDKGRFQKAKSAVNPGVESTKRCFLGQGKGPAQSPGVNRLSEAITVMLLEIISGNITKDGRRSDRMTVVEQTFNRIRSLIVANGRLRAETGLQMPLINITTLRTWYKNREARLEKEVLTKHLQLSVSATASPLPPARQPPTTLDEGHQENRHQFSLPVNVAGGKKKEKRQAHTLVQSAVPIAPNPSASVPLLFLPSPQPGGPPLIFTLPPALRAPMEVPPASTSAAPTSMPQRPLYGQPVKGVSRTTTWRRKKQEELGVQSRKYVRKEGTICKQCQKERAGDSHGQFYGAWWCKSNSPLSFAEWKQQQKDLRCIKKKAPPP